MIKLFFIVPILFLIFCLLLTSCAIYNQEFDSPPPVGVPCTSVTDLESMVVETDKGPDLFIPIEKEVNSISKCPSSHEESARLNRKVWICHQQTEEGCEVQGHYIYWPKATGQWDLNNKD